MIERAIVLAGVFVLVIVATLAVRALASRRATAVHGVRLPVELRQRLDGGGVVYFFGTHCASCRQQGQILDRLSEDTGTSILRINAVEEPKIADSLNILTVPTTVVVDEQHRVRALNPGFRSRQVLESQLSERVMETEEVS